MKVAEKEKITEAMKLCESKMQSFFNYLDDTLPKDQACDFKDFLLAKTFFAGGVFRSVLSGTNVNDVDVFFKSLDDVLQFKHMVMAAPVKIFKEVTPNGSYNCKPNKGPKISFTTRNYGPPPAVLSRFDLSFNQHFYDMQRMEMRFDRDTFDRMGFLNRECMDKSGSVARVLRFLNQGWKVEQESILEALRGLCSKDKPFPLGSSGQGTPEPLRLTKKAYTDKDYFGSPPEKEIQKKYMLKTARPTQSWTDPAAWNVTSGPTGNEIPAPLSPVSSAAIEEEIVRVRRNLADTEEEESIF